MADTAITVGNSGKAMSLMVWVVFFVLYLGVLALDLVVLHRESKEMSVRQALGWTVVWILVALSFSGLVYGVYEHHWFGWRVTPDAPRGARPTIQYITGYLLEWSLSVDNIFVIAVIFTFMKIPAQFQYRVLFWGIVGAILLRGAMIAAGAALIHAFDWMFYVFGAILLLSAARMLKSEDDQFDPGKSVLVRLARRGLSGHRQARRRTFLHDGRWRSRTPRRCSSPCCWSTSPTWCSRSTRFPPSSR